MSSFLEELMEKGFVKLSEPDGLSILNINNYKLINNEERARDNTKDDLHPDLVFRLNTFNSYIRMKYIDPQWPDNEFIKFLVWEGVDKDNQKWHTDSLSRYDIFFLYYLDDTFPETGGSISFRWGMKDGKTNEEVLQPKAGDLVIINNMRGFWHKASSTSIQRRIASFEYRVGLKDV